MFTVKFGQLLIFHLMTIALTLYHNVFYIKELLSSCLIDHHQDVGNTLIEIDGGWLNLVISDETDIRFTKDKLVEESCKMLVFGL